MSVRVISIILFFSCALIYSACISELEFEPDRDLENLVSIQGKLVKGDIHTITIFTSKVRDFSGRNTPVLVKAATLFNELGQSIEIPLIATGVNQLRISPDSDDFVIDDFMAFYIEVRVDDGRLFKSEAEQLLPVPKVDSLTFEVLETLEIGPTEELITTEKVFLFVNTDLHVPNTTIPVSLRWTYEEVYELTEGPIIPTTAPLRTCYVTQSLGATQETVLNPINVEPERLDHFNLFERDITFTYAEANHFIAMQHSLTNSAFEYFDMLSNVITRSGSIFDTPAGLVSTNITNVGDPSEEVFGFFYATEIDTARVFISKEATGCTARRCPPMYPPDDACVNCLLERRSTLTQPDWWME